MDALANRYPTAERRHSPRRGGSATDADRLIPADLVRLEVGVATA
jgi:hypothetical protein